jgi:hypothetical protein
MRRVRREITKVSRLRLWVITRFIVRLLLEQHRTLRTPFSGAWLPINCTKEERPGRHSPRAGLRKNR